MGVGGRVATEPDIDRIIRRLRELNGRVSAIESQPRCWVVACESWGFAFYSTGATALEAWQAALKQAEAYAKQRG
jgi:hypothetical protein